MGTLVERSSRYVMLLHLPDGRFPIHVDEAMRRAVRKLPKELFPDGHVGSGQRDASTRRLHRRHRGPRPTSVTHAHPGSEAPTRTPMDSCANTCPGGPTSPSIRPPI